MWQGSTPEALIRIQKGVLIFARYPRKPAVGIGVEVQELVTRCMV